ncbi:hypothetical protein BJ684DRAFT_22862 [Piptocephalis cylindrospora]|uniref:YMC020W-like alpha/beta hydrolase domain-containing protein n=1 Tax=Piptocephalis cylindrospora TaxID=1907219 RepID=A0A4P9Y2S5_9FUNG|nr:hypothetical protein BJ684DRAFT_22862 [Piptocephalis cylindrospora]|eukprot:RKP13167.1 hypothetical protein BJ684DRAFT_22862 [Piptocephalis cylindrospora]
MEKALRRHLSQAHGMTLAVDAVTLIPLRGEGKVESRVDRLYASLLAPQVPHWRKAVRQADLVLVATHSQGTPVSTLLLDRLIGEGMVEPTRQRIGLLAMAGISHGPFPYLRGNVIVKYFEAEAARELFDFMRSDSQVSRMYREAMHRILAHGVKVVGMASMADQVVPLYSATMFGFSHPSLLRAVYVDGHDYRPDFLTHLITFLLRVRNHGIPDHGLAVHLSEVLAGSLYSGTQGHSTIYEDLGPYTLAIRWVLESPWVSPHPIAPELQAFGVSGQLNPYYLPWILRGILEDPRLRKNSSLVREVEGLKDLFDGWEPTSRAMRDLKFRLEPIRARL